MLLDVSDLSYSPEGEASSGFSLQNVGFQVGAGDFWVILGSSGAGKTTLLQLLAGLLPPSAGEVTLNQEKDTLRQHIGLVFQYPEHQFFQSTVKDDISYALRQRGVEEAEIEVCATQALKGMGLEYEELKSRSPFELSGGEQRRLAIACVLVNKPQVLLLDEPTTGLDAQAKKAVLGWIERLNSKEGMAILLATSSLEEIPPLWIPTQWVAHLAQKLIILSRGKQIYCGEAKEVFTQPQILSKAGLRLPPLLELGCKLRQLGYPVEHPLAGVDEALVQLKRLFGKPIMSGNQF